MAVWFDKRKAKTLINAVEKLLNDIEKSYSYLNDRERYIRKQFDLTAKSGYFANAVSVDLLGNTPVKSVNFESLTISMNMYVLGADIVKEIKALGKQIDDYIKKSLETLRFGCNPIIWVLSSNKKKQKIKDSYNRINEFVDSELFKSANKQLIDLKNLNEIEFDEAYNGFIKSKGTYEKLIKGIVLDDTYERIDFIAKLFYDYDNLNKKICFIKSKMDNDRQMVSNAISILINRVLISVLSTRSIEELRQYKKGIRLKYLINAGYTTIGSVYAASSSRLATIYGISYSGALQIKEAVDYYANAVVRYMKIPFSYYQRNEDSSNVIKSVCIYKQKLDIASNTLELLNEKTPFIMTSIKVLNELGSGAFWIFMSDVDKDKAKKCYNGFSDLVYGEFGKLIDSVYIKMKEIKYNPSIEESWNDYLADYTLYKDIIKRVRPGINYYFEESENNTKTEGSTEKPETEWE